MEFDFNDPPAQSHSATSLAAASSVKTTAGKLRLAVLTALLEDGPMTDEQMQDHLGMNPSTQRPRRVELVRAGLVRDAGRRAFTRSGRSAVLWEAV